MRCVRIQDLLFVSERLHDPPAVRYCQAVFKAPEKGLDQFPLAVSGFVVLNGGLARSLKRDTALVWLAAGQHGCFGRRMTSTVD